MSRRREPAGDAHVTPLLDRYRTGELDRAAREQVAAHLAACPACSAELEDLTAFAAAAARGFDARQAHAGHEPDWERQRRAILARTSGRQTATRAERRPRPRLLRYAPQAALLLVAAIAVGVMIEGGVRGPQDIARDEAGSARSRGAGPAFQDSAGDRSRPRPETAAARDELDRAAAATPTPRGEEATPPAPARDDPVARTDRKARVDEEIAIAEQTGEAAPQGEQPAAREERTVSQARFTATWETAARRALAVRDSQAVRDALDQWDDSLGHEALADSLADFLDRNAAPE